MTTQQVMQRISEKFINLPGFTYLECEIRMNEGIQLVIPVIAGWSYPLPTTLTPNLSMNF